MSKLYKVKVVLECITSTTHYIFIHIIRNTLWNNSDVHKRSNLILVQLTVCIRGFRIRGFNQLRSKIFPEMFRKINLNFCVYSILYIYICVCVCVCVCVWLCQRQRQVFACHISSRVCQSKNWPEEHYACPLAFFAGWSKVALFCKELAVNIYCA